MHELFSLLHRVAQWWYWSTQIHLWYAPYAGLLLIELLFGRKVRARWRDVAFNFVFVTIYATIFALVNEPLKRFSTHLASSMGGPLLDLSFNAGNSLLLNIAALFVYLLIYDFFSYWWHRSQHRNQYLWPTHKLHHADQNMGVTTTVKVHPVNELGKAIAIALPISVLFKLEPINIFWITYAARLFEHFVHMNIDLHFGRLGWLLTSPNLHRVHHSTRPQHRDKNFAVYFPFYDRLFGTYCPPDADTPPTGLHTGETYTTMWHAYLQPFGDWGKLLFRRPRVARR